MTSKIFGYLDMLFSRFVRLRDKYCIRCGAAGEIGADGARIIGLECMHYVTRDNWATRVDPENADAGCFMCHRHFEQFPAEHEEFKRAQLGDEGFEALLARGRSISKRNIREAIKYVRSLLKTVEGK